MSVVCSICGGTHITCAAIVDPNTKQFIDFGYEAWLDEALVHRLLDEERLMKIGEADGFKLQLTFVWFVELKRENIGDFKYIVNAYCLDNPQTLERRYTTMEAVLLHCLNDFNENIRLPNRYRS